MSQCNINLSERAAYSSNLKPECEHNRVMLSEDFCCFKSNLELRDVLQHWRCTFTCVGWQVTGSSSSSSDPAGRITWRRQRAAQPLMLSSPVAAAAMWLAENLDLPRCYRQQGSKSQRRLNLTKTFLLPQPLCPTPQLLGNNAISWVRGAPRRRKQSATACPQRRHDASGFLSPVTKDACISSQDAFIHWSSVAKEWLLLQNAVMQRIRPGGFFVKSAPWFFIDCSAN